MLDRNRLQRAFKKGPSVRPEVRFQTRAHLRCQTFPSWYVIIAHILLVFASTARTDLSRIDMLFVGSVVTAGMRGAAVEPAIFLCRLIAQFSFSCRCANSCSSIRSLSGVFISVTFTMRRRQIAGATDAGEIHIGKSRRARLPHGAAEFQLVPLRARSAAQHSFIAGRRRTPVAERVLGVGIRLIPIFTPFRDITRHLKNAVGRTAFRIRIHRSSRLILRATAAIPPQIVIVPFVPPGKQPGVRPARCLFPFDFGG